MEQQNTALESKFWLKFEVRAYEADVYNRVSLVTIANYLQEAAGQHADSLGIGVTDLLRNDFTWVLTRLKIEMQQYPARYESIHILTYPSGFDKYFVYRNFILYNEDKQQIGRATSTWAVMDIKARKMVGVPSMISDIPIPQDVTFTERTKGKIAKVTAPLTEEAFKVRWFDLDTNQHTNNAYYLQWAIESLPKAVLEKQQLASIDLMYRIETIWKDDIAARTEKAESDTDKTQAFIHQLVRKSDQKELAQAVTRWSTDGIIV